MPVRGRHACAFGATLDEQFGLAAPFLRAGLARGEKACYMAHETDLREVERRLKAAGMPLKVRGRPGVELLSCEAAGLARLPFNPRRTMTLWMKTTQSAVREGFPGLRVVVEMTWAIYGGLERLAEYEAASADLFRSQPLRALCLYNRLRFCEQVARDEVLAQPRLGVQGEIAGNPDYAPCDALLARRRAARLSASGPRARSDRRGPPRA